MTHLASLLEEALEAWADARQGVIAEVDNIPADKFSFRPAPEVRSVTELVQHILEVSIFMAGELTRPDTNLRRKPFPELIAEYAAHVYEADTKQALLELARSSLEEGQRQFRDAGELAMLQLITRFDGQPGTKLAWLHHGIAQEEYHRGQLTVYERLMGIEPALTKLIRGG